jgi:hypothetical protein
MGRWSGVSLIGRGKPLIVITCYRVPASSINSAGPLTSLARQHSHLSLHTVPQPNSSLASTPTKHPLGVTQHTCRAVYIGTSTPSNYGMSMDISHPTEFLHLHARRVAKALLILSYVHQVYGRQSRTLDIYLSMSYSTLITALSMSISVEPTFSRMQPTPSTGLHNAYCTARTHERPKRTSITSAHKLTPTGSAIASPSYPRPSQPRPGTNTHPSYPRSIR